MSAGALDATVTHFHVAGLPMAADTADLLGVWETIPATSRSLFDVTDEQAEAPVWRVELAPDLAQATADLAHCEQLLAVSQQALPLARRRFDAYLHRVSTAGGTASAFTVGELESCQPESDLGILLPTRYGEEQPEPFFMGDRLTRGWAETANRVHVFVAQVVRFLAHYAWIETTQEAIFVGRTEVGWTGDIQTIWRAGVKPALAGLHQRNVALALASRATLLRLFAIITEGALSLAVCLATPGGAILTLPAAWRFINGVLAEHRRYHHMRS